MRFASVQNWTVAGSRVKGHWPSKKALKCPCIWGVKEDTLKKTTNHEPEAKAPENEENSENSEMKYPKRPGPGASAVEIWQWMEELNSYNQIQALKALPKRLPPKHPYKPKDERPAPPKTAPENSEDRLKAMIKLGEKMAEQEARRMLAHRTQEVWSKMGKSGPPPDMWSRLEEAERYRRPPRTVLDQNHR
jgi:hypothetical protein